MVSDWIAVISHKILVFYRAVAFLCSWAGDNIFAVQNVMSVVEITKDQRKYK